MLKQIFAIYLLIFLAGFTTSRLVPKLTNIVCQTLDKRFCEYERCKLIAIKRDVSEMSIYVKLKQTPINNISIALMLRRSGNNRGKSIVEINFDACAFLRNKKRNPIAAMFYKTMGLDTNSNINHTCPYDHDVILDRYRIDEKFMHFGEFLTGHYTFSSVWSAYRIPRALVNISIQVVERV